MGLIVMKIEDNDLVEKVTKETIHGKCCEGDTKKIVNKIVKEKY